MREQLWTIESDYANYGDERRWSTKKHITQQCLQQNKHPSKMPINRFLLSVSHFFRYLCRSAACMASQMHSFPFLRSFSTLGSRSQPSQGILSISTGDDDHISITVLLLLPGCVPFSDQGCLCGFGTVKAKADTWLACEGLAEIWKFEFRSRWLGTATDLGMTAGFFFERWKGTGWKFFIWFPWNFTFPDFDYCRTAGCF